VQTVHLNIAWLPADSKIYLVKRAAAKAQRLFIRLQSWAHCGSDASHDPLFSLQTRRTLWKLGMSAKPTSFIRDLAEYVTRGVLLFEAISIDCRRERATLLSRKVIGSPKHCYEQAY